VAGEGLPAAGISFRSSLEFHASAGIFEAMSTATAEIVRLCEALPEEKRMEVMDFARFLLGRSEHPGDLAWEQLLADPARRPKLEAFLQESAAESGDEPLDLSRL
jgi:hypothetical protein